MLASCRGNLGGTIGHRKHFHGKRNNGLVRELPLVRQVAAKVEIAVLTAHSIGWLTGNNTLVVQASNLAGGIDGIYVLSSCYNGKPMYRRKASPANEERVMWYSSTFGDWDVSKVRTGKPPAVKSGWESLVGPIVAVGTSTTGTRTLCQKV